MSLPSSVQERLALPMSAMLNHVSEEHELQMTPGTTIQQQVLSAPTPACTLNNTGAVLSMQLSASAQPVLTTSAVTTPTQTSRPQSATDSANYDRETILILIAQMKHAGYGNRKQQKRSLKKVFTKATELAKREHGITRSVKAWQKRFTRMKQEYSAYIAKISQSGRDGDDKDLYDKPEFFKEMHELEHDKPRHSPPAVLSSSSSGTLSDCPTTSSRKRMKLTHNSALEPYLEKQRDRHDVLIAEIKKSNEEKAKMRSIMEKLVDKI